MTRQLSYQGIQEAQTQQFLEQQQLAQVNIEKIRRLEAEQAQAQILVAQQQQESERYRQSMYNAMEVARLEGEQIEKTMRERIERERLLGKERQRQEEERQRQINLAYEQEQARLREQGRLNSIVNRIEEQARRIEDEFGDVPLTYEYETFIDDVLSGELYNNLDEANLRNAQETMNNIFNYLNRTRTTRIRLPTY